jgi:hypothetical protein
VTSDPEHPDEDGKTNEWVCTASCTIEPRGSCRPWHEWLRKAERAREELLASVKPGVLGLCFPD